MSGRRSKKPVEVTLFVHRVLKASLLCSEHGRNDFSGGELAGGKVLPWSQISWPDGEEKKKFRDWEIRRNPEPLLVTFALPEWLAWEKGLI